MERQNRHLGLLTSCDHVQTMRFRGPNVRYAITTDFDLQHGGEIEFHMMCVELTSSRRTG